MPETVVWHTPQLISRHEPSLYGHGIRSLLDRTRPMLPIQPGVADLRHGVKTQPCLSPPTVVQMPANSPAGAASADFRRPAATPIAMNCTSMSTRPGHAGGCSG